MIDDYDKEELADSIAQERTDNAEIDELKSYFYNAQYESLNDDYSKEELYQIYIDMGLED